VQQDRLGLDETRVELGIADRAGQIANPAREHDRRAVARRDDTEERQDVVRAPTPDLTEALEQEPPDREEGQVVQAHEGRLQPERAAQRQARTQVHHHERAREADRAKQTCHD